MPTLLFKLTTKMLLGDLL